MASQENEIEQQQILPICISYRFRKESTERERIKYNGKIIMKKMLELGWKK